MSNVMFVTRYFPALCVSVEHRWDSGGNARLERTNLKISIIMHIEYSCWQRWQLKIRCWPQCRVLRTPNSECDFMAISYWESSRLNGMRACIGTQSCFPHDRCITVASRRVATLDQRQCGPIINLNGEEFKNILHFFFERITRREKLAPSPF